MKISIIIPVFNDEDYIADTIETVLNQTYTDYELILVNDGSTDKSLELMKSFSGRDERIVIIDRPHEGLSAARMTGLTQASGEWIVYIDGDDAIAPDFLEEMLNGVLDDQVEIVQCAYIDFYLKKGTHEELFFNRSVKDSNFEKYTGKETLLLNGTDKDLGITTGPWGKLYKQSLFYKQGVKEYLSEGRLKIPYNYFNDFTLIPVLQYYARKIVYTDYVGYYHRRGNGGISQTPRMNETLWERCRAVNLMISWFEDKNEDQIIVSMIYHQFLFLLSYWYKGFRGYRNSDEYRKYTDELADFYHMNYKYVVKANKTRNSNKLYSLIISLWRKSPELWAFLIGNLYFKPKYNY